MECWLPALALDLAPCLPFVTAEERGNLMIFIGAPVYGVLPLRDVAFDGRRPVSMPVGGVAGLENLSSSASKGSINLGVGGVPGRGSLYISVAVGATGLFVRLLGYGSRT